MCGIKYFENENAELNTTLSVMENIGFKEGLWINEKSCMISQNCDTCLWETNFI